MRKNSSSFKALIPQPVLTALGVTTGLGFALLLKACGPLAPSVDKSRPPLGWSNSGGSAPGSSSASPYRAAFFRDQAPQIAVPGLSSFRRVALSSEAVEALRHESHLELHSQPTVQPQGIIALFKLDLPDSEILELGLEDLETTLVQIGNTWTIEVPRRNAAQQALWDRVKVHLMSLHLAVIFAEDAPQFTLDWIPSAGRVDALPAGGASPSPSPSPTSSSTPANPSPTTPSPG